jgi:membrane-anchored glycerophosphoryl diester phosphodiesterase (GDPDase)
MVKKIFEFMKNNPYLTVIMFLLFFIMILVVQSKNENVAPEPENPVIEKMQQQYEVIAESRDLKFYREYGKYYVIVNDIALNDKQIIRNTLDIPSYIDFEIVIPGALLREYANREFNYQE